MSGTSEKRSDEAKGTTLSSKDRRFQEFQRRRNEEKKSLPPVENPMLKLENNTFFQTAKQRNMQLEADNVNTALTNMPNSLGVTAFDLSPLTICHPRPEPIFICDNESFQMMIDAIKGQTVISFDLEGHQEHSYLGAVKHIMLGYVTIE